MEYTAFHCTAWSITHGCKDSMPTIAVVHELDSGRFNFIAVSLHRRSGPEFKTSSAPRFDRQRVTDWMCSFVHAYFDKRKPPLCDKHTLKT